ncbi:hypothetical protein GOC57_11675 [Sinorhizobium meliloti]|nr:hypothetical protein [Sinorhizobium meliloti]MDW9859446.1 hypothetical protein [Sinorhizobium meliloti]MDW9964567.1 hypothetical protein [Sinorhizobium meliloti]MDX0336835.1 hypothetical protein [Sinorhizobium meliloti]
MPKAGSWRLCEFIGEKIRIECECGVRKTYDAKAMLDRIGDRSMPGLLTELAIANGCDRTTNKFYDRCKLHYGETIVAKEGLLSRGSRPTVRRRRPALQMKSPLQICRIGMSSSASVAPAAAKAGLTDAAW